MRVTKESLLNLTKSYISKRIRLDRSIICIYLTGSMLAKDPFINGSTDVDLVFVHEGNTEQVREIIKISPEITFDIHHLNQGYFTPPRKVRTDPWIGSSLCFDPVVLYGKGHWFEFTLASIEANFFLPENIIQRAYQFSNNARNLWLILRSGKTEQESIFVQQYIKILENASNAIACLSSFPLTDRIFMKNFKVSAESINKPELTGELYGLILGEADPTPYFDYYFNSWKYYLEYFGKSELVNQYPQYDEDRLQYYTKPVDILWKDHLPSALWIMTKTWSRVVAAFQLDINEYFHSFCSIIEIGPSYFPKRAKQIEDYLDLVEESLVDWGKQQGLEDKSQIIL